MEDDKKYDEETQKFYEENKEMIDRILAKNREDGTDKDKAYMDEMMRRAAFERRMRAEMEAEKARRKAFEGADRAYSDYLYGRERTEEALDEGRDHLRDYSRRQRDYISDMLYDEADRVRDGMDRGRRYAEDRYDEDLERLRDARDRTRQAVNDGFDDVFGPLTDSRFQKHLVGAGLEMWMALNALVRAGPLPESVKNAFTEADKNKNAEFCTKNEYCRKREGPSKPSSDPQPITIKPVEKDTEETGEKKE